jgi:hypothetical protein
MSVGASRAPSRTDENNGLAIEKGCPGLQDLSDDVATESAEGCTTHFGCKQQRAGLAPKVRECGSSHRHRLLLKRVRAPLLRRDQRPLTQRTLRRALTMMKCRSARISPRSPRESLQARDACAQCEGVSGSSSWTPISTCGRGKSTLVWSLAAI